MAPVTAQPKISNPACDWASALWTAATSCMFQLGFVDYGCFRCWVSLRLFFGELVVFELEFAFA